MESTTLSCMTCNKSFDRCTKEVRRQFKNGNTKTYCSRSCAAKGNKALMQQPGCPRNLVGYAGNRRDEYTEFRIFMRSAKKRDVSTNLNIQYLKDLWLAQNSRCALTGLPLSFNASRNMCFQASLDRIDSTKGYVRENVQFVCLAINYAKNNTTDQNVREWIEAIRQNIVR